MTLIAPPSAWSKEIERNPVASCVQISDDAARLACFDAAFNNTAEARASAAKAPTAVPLAAEERTTQPEHDTLGLGMARSWEVTPGSQSNRLAIRTYTANYLLPAHYTSSVNLAPSSPTRGTAPAHAGYRNADMVLQVALRTKVMSGLLQPYDGLWLAYTQNSSWQIWDGDESRPFRNTDYQPEVIYVAPPPAGLPSLPGGWQVRLWQFGFAHQSNGQTNPLSRSWNRLFFRVGADNGRFGLMAGLDHRLRETRNEDDNPDLVDYVGKVELRASWDSSRARTMLRARLNPSRLDRGSLQLNWSYPVYADDPSGVRWYVQAFTGYGETLLDYNHRQTSVGLGLMLFQF
ncbi:MAG: phospholipase A [Burkholderiaceae bacterium]|nr:phospholipase A [Burkholderiaceae bacterium]